MSFKLPVKKVGSQLVSIIRLVSILFVLLIIWQLVATFSDSKLAFPSAVEVIEYLFDSFIIPIGRYTILGHIGASLARVLIGFLIASVSGCIIGIVMGWSKMANAIIKPIFEIFRPIPPIAWIPLAILWFGIGESSKYFIIFIAAFIPVLMNAYMGAIRVDPVLIGASKMLGANSKQIFTRIIFPSSVPSIFAGLQIGLSNAWMVVLAAEMVRSSEGLGWMIVVGMESGKIVQIITGMIAISIVGLLLVNIMRGVESRLCRWNNRGR